VLLVGMLVLLV
jgi:hypothetical protein